MFDIYIKDFNQNGSIVIEEILVQTIPAEHEGDLKLISPIVKNEMGNAASLDFSIEAGTAFYDAFLQMKTHMRITYDGEDIFNGRVLTIDNNTFRRTRRIRCEGAFTYLIDSPVEGVPEAKRGKLTIGQYLTNLLNNHNTYVNDTDKSFYVGEVPGYYSSGITSEQQIKNDTRNYGSDSWTDTKSALEDLRSHYGGFFRTRTREGGGVYLDWLNHYFSASENPQTIEVGKNILDISDVTEIDNIFTAIIPIGKTSSNKTNGALYIDGYRTEVHGNNKMLKVPDICSVYSDAQLNSGYHRADYYRNAINNYGMIIKPVTFNDATTKEKLFSEACEWIKNNYQGDVVKFTIKAIDMRQIGENTSKIMVGDRVRIRYLVGDETGAFSWNDILLTCLSVSYDLYHPENNSYTFGIPANILTKTYGVKQKTKGGIGGGASGSSVKEDEELEDVGQEGDWLAQVCGWLQDHGLYYNGPRPWDSSKGSKQEGSSYESGEFLLQMPPVGRPRMVRAWKINSADPEEDRTYEGQIAYLPEGVDVPTRALLGQYNVIEYVRSEYGFDLSTGLSVKAPLLSIDEETGAMTGYQEVVDPETGETITLQAWYTSSSGLVILDRDGESIKSYLDPEGNYHYFWQDPATGQIIETNVRDLNIQQIDNDRKIGWVVSENDQGDLAFANPGEISLAIENQELGEIVVLRASGEEMYLGNHRTEKFTQVSLQHMDLVTGDFDYVTDAHGVTSIVVKSGGGMRIRHGKILGYEEGTGLPIYETNSDGSIAMAEFGLYDDNTLHGGVIVEKLNDGTVVTKIRGDRVDLSTNEGFASLIIDNTYIRAEVADARSQMYSIIVQTASLVRSEVGNAVSGIYRSVIEQTATYIRSEVSNAASAITQSVITQTAGYIETVVADIASDVAWSVIRQTASEITATVHRKAQVYVQPDNPYPANTINNGDIWVECEDHRTHQELSNLTLSQMSTKKLADLYGARVHVWRNGQWTLVVDQMALRETEVHVDHTDEYYRIWAKATDLLGEEYRSNLTVTAQKISSDVSTAKSNLYSAIAQTATSINTRVADVKRNLESTIEQTASHIVLSVNAAKSLLYAAIDITSTQILSRVGNVEEGLESVIQQTPEQIALAVNNAKSELKGSIKVQADKISLVVEGTGTNAKISRASIVSAINNGGSSVTISADQIQLEGQVKLSQLTGDFIASKITTSNNITANNLSANYIHAARIYAYKGTTPYGSSDYRDVRDYMFDFLLDGPGNNNTYTLKKKPFHSSTWSNIGSFSRAVTSWNWGWGDGDGRLTVTPVPQGSPDFTVTVRPTMSYSTGTHKYTAQVMHGSTVVASTTEQEGVGWSYGWKEAANSVSYTSGSTWLMVPSTTSPGSTRTLYISDTYVAGHDSAHTMALANNDGALYGSSISINAGSSIKIKPAFRKSDGTYYIGTTATTVSASSGGGGTIDIPTNQIYTTSSYPSGTQLTTLRNRCNQAKSDGDYVCFRVDCGSSQKWYFMDFT